MRHKALLRLLQNFSPLLFEMLCIALLIIALQSCENGPKVTVYVSDPAHEGMEYYNENTGQKGFIAYPLTDKFICFNQTDFNELLNFCHVKK